MTVNAQEVTAPAEPIDAIVDPPVGEVADPTPDDSPRRVRVAAGRVRTAAVDFVQAPDVTRPPWWERRPESIADLVRYTRAGNWAPGDQHRLIESAGKAYGYLIAIPGNLTLRGIAWLLARPSRALTALVLLTITRFTITGSVW